MRSLKDYIAETEVIVESPQVGDDFDLDLAADCLIETYVAESDHESITVYVDESAYETLERGGYLGETIRRYGPVGSSMATGRSILEAEKCSECGYSMEECCCEPMEEGHMKDIDIERQDYENLSPLAFRNRYHMSKEQWHDQHKDLLSTKQPNTADKDFGRILELAGVSDHKFDREDDVYCEMDGVADGKYDREDDQYCEDQDAAVVAQKELDTAITNPMPGVQEGVMKSIATELGDIANNEDFDKLYDLMTSTSPAGQMVQKIADEISINHHLYDDDHEELLELIMDRLIDDFGGNDLDEAEYQGKKVTLNKPTRGDVKKFKVYVKDPKTGNVKKVNFGHGGTSAKRAGQKTMRIKKSNPARRRSFRARHHCENPGPKTKARYWSCRAW